MIRSLGRIVAAGALGWMAILYVTRSIAETVTALQPPADARSVYSLAGAQVLLVAAWTWLLITARAHPVPRMRVALRLVSLLIVLLLAFLATASYGEVVGPARDLTGILTAIYFLVLISLRYTWILTVVVLVFLAFSGVAASASYFGLVLVALGDAAIRGGLRTAWTEIIPPAVGGRAT